MKQPAIAARHCAQSLAPLVAAVLWCGSGAALATDWDTAGTELTQDQSARTSEASGASERADLEVFKGPQLTRPVPLRYPKVELARRQEGWVKLSLMVDSAGHPYEIAPIGSMGRAAFIREAVLVAESLRFELASLNGVPVDAGFEFRVNFSLGLEKHGADPKFARRYRGLRKALNRRDRGAVEEKLARLDARNLYEDA